MSVVVFTGEQHYSHSWTDVLADQYFTIFVPQCMSVEASISTLDKEIVTHTFPSFIPKTTTSSPFSANATAAGIEQSNSTEKTASSLSDWSLYKRTALSSISTAIYTLSPAALLLASDVTSLPRAALCTLTSENSSGSPYI